MKVLVTGATGFVGSHLVNFLSQMNHEIVLVVRNPENPELYPILLRNKKIRVMKGDITNKESISEAVEDCEVVFHLAAMLGNFGVPIEQYYKTNVFGTLNVLEASQKAKVRRFIHLSTTGVMGKLAKLPARVDCPCKPDYGYEKTKYVAEKIVMNKVLLENFPATIIRPTHIFGPGDMNTLQLIQLIKKIKVLPLPNGGLSSIQPLYINDLIQLLCSCMHYSSNGIYLAAGKNIVTFRQFINLLSKLINSKTRVVGVPYRLLQTFSALSERFSQTTGISPILPKYRLEFFTRNHVYDITQTKTDLDWSPETDIQTGLTETISWYKANRLI